MFLEKLTRLVDNFHEVLLSSSDGISDELVKTITFIQFTDEDACQNLFDVLHSLECFMKRNRFDKKSEGAGCTCPNFQVFESLKLKINQFIDEDVENPSKTHSTLSPESIMTLCLLYLENGSLDDKCHEKLKSVLHLACTDEKTCKFVVWCFLSILKEGSVRGFEKNANGSWPAWVPIRNIDDQAVGENSSGVLSENVLDLLAAIVWNYPLCKEPNFEQFWEMALNYEKIPDLEIWASGNKTEGSDQINRSISDARVSTLNFLLSELELGKVELETRDKIISKIIGSMDEKQKLDLMSECVSKFKSETLETTRAEAAITYLFLAKNFDENQIYGITKPHKETINQMLRLITEHPFAKLFYSIFEKCHELLEFETELKYFARKITESCEIGHWLYWTKLTPMLEKFENSSVDILDLLLALEILIPTIAQSDGDDNLVQELILDFARKNRELINEALDNNKGWMFSGGALLSVLKSQPEVLKFGVMTKYINVWEGKKNERALWETLGYYINLLTQDDLAFQVCETICRFLQSRSFDETLQSEFVAKNRSIINEHIQHGNIPKNSALCYFLNVNQKPSNFEAKRDRVSKICQRKLCDFLEDSFHLFAISSNDSRNFIVPIVESVCAYIITESCSTGQEFVSIFEKYSQVIGDMILPNFNQCDVNGLYILLAKNYPTINLDFPALSIETKMALIRHMNLLQLYDILKECFNSLMHSSNEVRTMTVSVVDAICLTIIDYSCFDKNLVSIFVEYSEVIADTILPNFEQREIKNLTTLLAMNHPKIVFNCITSSIVTKKAIIKNIQPLELCDFLSDSFDLFEKSPKSARESILQIIECVCVCINEHLPSIKKQSATVFARYWKMIADEILLNTNQNDIEILHKLIMDNYPRIVFNATTSSMVTKTAIVKNINSTDFEDFLKDSFNLLEKSSNRKLLVPIVESVCCRIISCSNSFEKQYSSIFAEHSKLIADEILSNLNEYNINSFYVLLTKNYPRIIFDFPALEIDTKKAILRNMNLAELYNFLKECFELFEPSSKTTRDSIISIIEPVCATIIDYPGTDVNHLSNIFAEYAKLIAELILPNWEPYKIRNLHILLAKNYARIILDYPSLSTETHTIIMRNMNPNESCIFFKHCFQAFSSSPTVFVSKIECICIVNVINPDGVGKEFTEIFEQYSDLIADEILPNWKHCQIKHFHILLALNYPIILDFTILSDEAKEKMVEIMKPTELYNFLNQFFHVFDQSSESEKNAILPIIDSVCLRITVLSDNVEKLHPIFEKYSKLIVDEILPNFAQCIFENLHALLTKTNSKLVFNFNTRLANLKQQLRKTTGTTTLTIDRRNVLDTSYNATSSLTLSQWMTSFRITFLNEPGIDAGGLLREWFTITSRAILNPDYGFFTTAPGDVNCYMINKSSNINEDHLKYFKGILEGKHTNCHLTKSLYKHILGVPLQYGDFQSEDPTYFKSLDFLVNNPMKDSGLELTFAVEVEEFGVVKERELMRNGKNTEVTDENKKKYARLVSHMKMTASIKAQLNSFIGGFHDIIPKHEIQNFHEHELELMLCGPSEIDIDDLNANTTYNSYRESDKVIQWFWRALRSFNKDDKARFLMFTTGSFKAPINGFATLQGNDGIRKFSIHKAGTVDNRLPRAHTCFNQLDLPQYTSYEKLREKLLLAIREGNEGFGIA